MKTLGPDQVLDAELTARGPDGAPFDAIFDAVERFSYFEARNFLTPHGMYGSTGYGRHLENSVLPLLTAFTPGRTVVFAYPRIDQSMVESIAGLLASGRFRPLIDRAHELGDIVEAYRYVERGEKVGNVLVHVMDA